MALRLGHYRSAADEAYWVAFESRLAELPGTDVDAHARSSLVEATYVDMTHRPDLIPEPEVLAETVHRLRYVLGPTVSRATLDEVQDALRREEQRLWKGGRRLGSGLLG